MRAVLALWIVCAAVVAWVWLRPLADAPLPPPRERAPRARKAASDRVAPVAAPEDEPVAEDPAAAPVRVGVPEMLNRHDLENGLERARSRVMQCREVEQFSGLLTVKLIIARSGNVQSATVLPPLEQTHTAQCVLKALRGVSFPRFRGTYLPAASPSASGAASGVIEWTYPFLFKDG